MEDDNFKMEVMKVRLSELNPDPANTRVHNQNNIDVITRSLKKFGQYRPFVVQKKGMVIRIGNGMFEAMRQLGWLDEDREVQIMLTDIDDEKATALSIVDNRTSDLSYFDDDMLRVVMKRLSEESLALTGFDDEEMQKYFIEDLDFGGVLDEVPKPPKVKVYDMEEIRLTLKFREVSARNSLYKFVVYIRGLYPGLSITECLQSFYRDKLKPIMEMKNGKIPQVH